jgi:hypothetical protein
MTSGRLALSLIPVGALTSSIRDGSHLIFVGGPGAFGLLADAPLPAPLGEQGFDAADAAPNDGIVQMAVSPWNNEKVVLVVSGNAEIGVIKAGQAVSAGVHPVGEQSNLALIAEVQPDALSAGEIGLDQTFADLGYAIETVSRIGVNAIEYRFEVPSGLIADREARLDLVFNHSALVDYERSGLVVRLNGEPIGSVRFSDESANAGQMTFNLPSSAVRPRSIG